MADPSAYTKPFQLTKSMTRNVYPAVDPKNPENKATGKVIIITGAGGGIGYDTATAWAQAGAAGIVLVGRSKDTLEAAAKNVESISHGLPVMVHMADVSSENDVKTLYENVNAKFGKANVLVNCAGSMGGGMIGNVEPSAWWQDIETNLKGTYLMIHYFIKTFGFTCTVVNIVSLGASFIMPGISSYSTSKLGVIKLGEYLDAEHPELRVFSVHPGIVAASEGRGMVNEAFTPFAKDPTILTGALTTYLATPRAEYARGGFISVNWDVNELELHKEEIKEEKLLKLAFLNGKLGPDGHPWAA